MRAAALVAVALLLAGCGDPEPRFPIHQEIRFSLTLRNKSAGLLRDTAVDVFAPVKELANQRTTAITSSHPYELSVDEVGNQTLRFRVTIPPWGAQVVKVRAALALADPPNEISLDDEGAFLAATRFVEAGDARVRAVAADLGRGSDAEVARAAYAWVTANVKDPGYVREDRGAAWALAHLAGDCTEQAYLFSAFARARGIPSRTLAGFVVESDAVVHASDYHNWAEFYADGAWRVADPQRGEIEPRGLRYVAMRVVDPSEEPLRDAQRFVAFDPRLEVRLD